MSQFGTLPLRVLLVDDDEVVLAVAQDVLRRAGHRVLVTPRSSGVISEILLEKPDVVLVDLEMPRLKGDTLTRILLSANPRLSTRVLLWSSCPEAELREATLRAGAHGYICKTGRPDELLSQLERQLGRRSSGTYMRAARHFRRFSTGPPPAPPSTRPPPKWSGSISIPIVRALFIDDDPVILRAYERQLRGREIICDTQASGVAAWERLCSDRAVDVVVSDVMLPDLSGIELYRRAVKLRPSWAGRFIFVTGAERIEYVSDFLSAMPRVLRKPVDMARLREIILQVAAAELPRRPRLQEA